MGLMQMMPQTYKELRTRYGLGADPYDPHDNVMAGAAYLREMYNAYGFPRFLAAYNAGPGRLNDCLQHNRPLPDDTRRFMARIETHIADLGSRRRQTPENARQTASVVERARPMPASFTFLDAPPRDIVGLVVTPAMAEPLAR